jgi:ketosteroid isomerase-like protein
MCAVENVEVVRASMAAWNAGDMDQIRALLDPDVVLRMPSGWPEPVQYVGIEAAMREWEQLREVWKADAVEPIGEFHTVGNQVRVRARWRTAGAGPKAKMEMTILYRLRDGRIWLTGFFWDDIDALNAVRAAE